MEQLPYAIASYSSYKAQLNVSEVILIDILVDNSYLKTSYPIRNRVMFLYTYSIMNSQTLFVQIWT